MEKNCVTCQKLFYVKPSRPDRQYCSLRCRFPEDRLIEKECVICKKPFSVQPYRKEAKYCSPKCQHKGLFLKREELTCKGCGKTFEVRPGLKNRQYCSHECHLAHQEGAENPSWAGGSDKKNCLFCNKEFEAKRSRVNAKFCSFECRGKWQVKTGFRRKRISLICQNCGNSFEVLPKDKNTKFCSRKCYYMAYRKEPIKFNWLLRDKPRIKISCKVCSKEFLIIQSRKQNTRYCSQKCAGIGWSLYRRGNDNPNWNGGSSFAPYSIAFSKELKNKIKERDGYTCQYCFKKVGKKVRPQLHIHHVDYDKQNSSPKNLISLCIQCHMKTSGSDPEKRKLWINTFKTIMEARFPENT